MKKSNKIKAGLSLLVFMFGIAVVFAFGTPERLQTVYWFEVSPDGQTVIGYLGDQESDASQLCPLPEGTLYCALGFHQGDLDPSSPTPKLKGTVESDPLSYDDDQRYEPD